MGSVQLAYAAFKAWPIQAQWALCFVAGVILGALFG